MWDLWSVNLERSKQAPPLCPLTPTGRRNGRPLSCGTAKLSLCSYLALVPPLSVQNFAPQALCLAKILLTWRHWCGKTCSTTQSRLRPHPPFQPHGGERAGESAPATSSTHPALRASQKELCANMGISSLTCTESVVRMRLCRIRARRECC